MPPHEPRPCRHCGLPLDPVPPDRRGPRPLLHPACASLERRQQQAENNRKATAVAQSRRLAWLRKAQAAAGVKDPGTTEGSASP